MDIVCVSGILKEPFTSVLRKNDYKTLEVIEIGTINHQCGDWIMYYPIFNDDGICTSYCILANNTAGFDKIEGEAIKDGSLVLNKIMDYDNTTDIAPILEKNNFYHINYSTIDRYEKIISMVKKAFYMDNHINDPEIGKLSSDEQRDNLLKFQGI